LYLGDSGQVLKQFQENTFDALITDPPAAIKFRRSEWDSDKGGMMNWVNWLSSILKEGLRTLKPGAHAFVWAFPRTSHWTGLALELSGFEIRDKLIHIHGQGWGGKGTDIGKSLPAYKGWNTTLKPAFEEWWLCRKPISEKTVIDNVRQWGTGALNIDACREIRKPNDRFEYGLNGVRSVSEGNVYGRMSGALYYNPQLGRWPSNIIHDNSQTVLDLFPTTEKSRRTKKETLRTGAAYDGGDRGREDEAEKIKGYGDKGSTARYFSQVEYSIEEIITDLIEEGMFIYCPKATSKDRNSGLKGKNPHKTVKPTPLMQWLIRLTTAPNGIVLDPFMGSGTTGKACVREGTRFVGVEKSLRYLLASFERIRGEYNHVSKRISQ